MTVHLNRLTFERQDLTTGHLRFANTEQFGTLPPSMANTYGISDHNERRIRTRDKRCVYCGVKFRRVPRGNSATIEHFNNNGPFDQYCVVLLGLQFKQGGEGSSVMAEITLLPEETN